MTNKTIALIFAGGTGERMNTQTIPKQFLEVKEKPIIIHTLEKFEFHPQIDGIIIACVSSWIEHLNELILLYNLRKITAVVPGGKTGQLSIYNTLLEAKKFYNDNSIVLIHDGVRPLINRKIISECIECVEKNGNAITTTPAVETVIISDEDSKIEDVVQRSRCQLARAPQAFILKDILNVHQNALSLGINNSIDSATLMRSFGVELHTIIGPAENIKITTPIDFYTFKGILEAQNNLF